MRLFRYCIVTVCVSFAVAGHAQIDSTPHKVQFVTLDKNAKVEVLDWGGTGQPLILVPGLGDTAHVFDSFALKLTPLITFLGSHRVALELRAPHPPSLRTILRINWGRMLFQSLTR
ncbi:MAG: hypothetical protein WBE31_08250 [Candidatus Sulfotelmatobacter sp.]